MSKETENSEIDLNISGLILYNDWIFFFFESKKIRSYVTSTAMLLHQAYEPPVVSG